MKFNICAIVLISILGISPLCYAQTSTDKPSIEEVKQETQDLLQTLDAYTADRKGEAVRTTKTALDKLDKRLMRWRHMLMKAGTKTDSTIASATEAVSR